MSFNWVLGLDGGSIDAAGGSAGLSGAADRRRMQRIRARADAVLVGAATIRGEDPSLAVGEDDEVEQRLRAGRPAQPLPVVLSASGRLPADARLLADGEPRPLILTTEAGRPEADVHGERADVAILPARLDAVEGALELLAGRGVERLLVEGGPTVVRGFVAAGRVDEVNVTVSPRLGARLPGPVRPELVDALVDLSLASVERADDFLFLRYQRAPS